MLVGCVVVVYVGNGGDVFGWCFDVEVYLVVLC